MNQNNVVRRFLALKFQPKEKKEKKVERVSKAIREATGVSRGVATDIADALVRGREVERLAIQKGWPMEGSLIIGPTGEADLSSFRELMK